MLVVDPLDGTQYLRDPRWNIALLLVHVQLVGVSREALRQMGRHPPLKKRELPYRWFEVGIKSGCVW
jgi:hypothetical protein